jgi:hypothetical protein
LALLTGAAYSEPKAQHKQPNLLFLLGQTGAVFGSPFFYFK